MSINPFPLFDKGVCVGTCVPERDLDNDVLIAIGTTIINDKPVQYLYLRDMDYGMVIPEDIFNRLNDVAIQ